MVVEEDRVERARGAVVKADHTVPVASARSPVRIWAPILPNRPGVISVLFQSRDAITDPILLGDSRVQIGQIPTDIGESFFELSDQSFKIGGSRSIDNASRQSSVSASRSQPANGFVDHGAELWIEPEPEGLDEIPELLRLCSNP